MILKSKSHGPLALLATLLLAVTPVWSQEEAAEAEAQPEKRLEFLIEGWVVQPAGAGYFPATEADPAVSVANEQIETKFGTSRTDRYGIGYTLPGNMGKLVGGYQSVGFDTSDQRTEPGSYVFGESLAYTVPQGQIGGPGVADDGLADGFLYNTSTTLREYYIGYERRAFRTQRVEGRWSLGWRRSKQRRRQDINYYSIVSPLPPLLPPTGDCTDVSEPDGPIELSCPLSPRTDTASLASTFDGRGPMLRLDVDFNLWRDKLLLETAAGFTIQRGKMDADYDGSNSYYQCTSDAFEIVPDPVTGLPVVRGCIAGALVQAPWSELNQLIDNPGGDPIQVSESVGQFSLPVGIQSQSESISSEIIDLSIGLRWKVTRWFDLSAGFRSSSHSDVGLDIVPQQVSVTAGGVVGLPQVKTTRRTITYEGFFVGLVFKFL